MEWNLIWYQRIFTIWNESVKLHRLGTFLKYATNYYRYFTFTSPLPGLLFPLAADCACSCAEPAGSRNTQGLLCTSAIVFCVLCRRRTVTITVCVIALFRRFIAMTSSPQHFIYYFWAVDFQERHVIEPSPLLIT